MFFFITDEAVTSVDAFPAANRAVSTGAEGRGLQLHAGTSSD